MCAAEQPCGENMWLQSGAGSVSECCHGTVSRGCCYVGKARREERDQRAAVYPRKGGEGMRRHTCTRPHTHMHTSTRAHTLIHIQKHTGISHFFFLMEG